jgi:hypothetical protein
MPKQRGESSTISRGSTNVFDDLGYPDAAERQAKLRSVYALNQVLSWPQRALGSIEATLAFVKPSSSTPAGLRLSFA